MQNHSRKKEERKEVKISKTFFPSGCTLLNKASNMADVKTYDVKISINIAQANESIYITVCTNGNSSNSTFNVIVDPGKHHAVSQTQQVINSPLIVHRDSCSYHIYTTYIIIYLYIFIAVNPM